MLLLLAAVIIMSATGCVGTYNVSIDDPEHFITILPNMRYNENDQFTITTTVIMDAGLNLYVDNVFHSSETAVHTDNGYVWEYYVTMPNHDITISFRVYGGI